MEIYLDILFLENLVINYLILIVTFKFSKSKTSNLRLFLGAFLGAGYVIFLVLFPEMKGYYTTSAKIILSCVIIAVAFTPGKVQTFFKNLAIFYIATFIFAGAAFAFLYFNNTGGFVKSGIFYVLTDTKWSVLVLSLITVGIIIRIFWEIIQFKFIREKMLIPLKIAFGRNTIDLAALVDTGNFLHDPLSNMPVVIVEFKAIRTILPGRIREIFDSSGENDLGSVSSIISETKWYKRFRLIPFNSLGKENGMLIGFKPDYIIVGDDNNQKGVKDVIIGIYNKNLSNNQKYTALLGSELVA